jgi:hypothetical protein
MGGLKLRLASATNPPPEQSPEREALAEKIAAHKSSSAAITQLEVALHQAENKVFDMVRDVEVAEKNLEEGPDAAAEWLLAKAMGKEAGPAIDMNGLRAALADAKERLSIQREYRARLSATLGKARTDARWTEQHVRDAALKVLQTAANLAKLVAEVEAAQARFLDLGCELREVFSVGVLPERDDERRFTPARTVNELFFLPPASWLELMKTRPPANRWKAALEALCHDASAPLPE